MENPSFIDVESGFQAYLSYLFITLPYTTGE